MSDDLLRRFRDKMRSKHTRRRGGADAPERAEAHVPPDSIRIVQLQHGQFPEASRFNERFIPGVIRIRVTLEIGAGLRARTPLLAAAEREALLRLCPRLPEHRCAGGLGIFDALAGTGAADGEAIASAAIPDAAAGPVKGDGGDGLALAHLIEHVAIDLILTASRGRRCSGATCAHADRFDRFDLFLECAEPMLGRCAAVLAAAAVRDLCAGRDRLDLHGRCRDLLARLTGEPRSSLVAEDVASACGWSETVAVETLQALTRLGYLEPIPAAYTFSSSTGILYRRARPEGPALDHRPAPAPPAAPSR